MLDFFKAGGMPMFFVLLFSLLALVNSAIFVFSPLARRVPVLQALDRAVLYSALAGLVAAIAAVGYHVPADPKWSKSPELPMILLEGLAESMSAPIMGFTVLSLTAMLQAVGHRRLAAQAVG